MRFMSSIVALGLTASAASGCVVEPLEDGGLDGAVSESAPRAGSAAYNEAVQIIDETIALIVTTADPDIPWMLSMLDEQSGSVDFAALDAEELVALSAYFIQEASIDEVEIALMSMNDHGIPFDDSFDHPPVDDDGSLCDSRCAFFVERECVTDKFISLCFWPHKCDLGEGASECIESVPPDHCGGVECGEGERCARWVYREFECVQTCDSDADCSGGEQCKKPFGTTFKRCK